MSALDLNLRVAASSIAALILSACAGRDFEVVPDSVPVVPVDVVINSLKCGLAEAIARDKLDRSGLYGGVAKVTLSVNVVQGRTATGELSAGIPVASGSLTPKLTLGYESTLKRNSTIDFAINLNTRVSDICSLIGIERQDAGFSLWLSHVVSGINAAVGGAPTASMTKYIYESDFVVELSGSAGIEANIVPVKVSAGASATRSDIQNMKIEIGAVRNVKGKFKPGGPEYIIQ